MTSESSRIYFHSTLKYFISKDQGKWDFHDMTLLINGEFCFPSINDEGLLERLLCFYEWHFILIGSLFRAIASSDSLDCCSCGSCCVRIAEVVNTHSICQMDTLNQCLLDLAGCYHKPSTASTMGGYCYKIRKKCWCYRMMDFRHKDVMVFIF